MASEIPQERASEVRDAERIPDYAPTKAKADGKFHVVDEQEIERVVERAIMRAEAFSGPTPHPDHLDRYEATHPGAAQIIFEEYQANSRHNREMERATLELQRSHLEKNHDLDRTSSTRAFWLVLAGMLTVGGCAYLHETTLGGVVAGTLLVAVLRSYLPKGWLRKHAPGKAQPKDTNSEIQETETGTSDTE